MTIPTFDKSGNKLLLSEECVDALIESVTLLPIRKSANHTGPQGKHEVDFLYLGRAIARSGVPAERLRDTGNEYRMPWLRVTFKPEHVQDLLRFSIYGDEPTLAGYHSLRMEGAELKLHLHRISARDRHVATFSPSQMESLERRVADLIAERDVAFAPIFAVEKRRKELAAEIDACGNSVEKQLMLLKVDGQNITLPSRDFVLSQYAEIKRRVVKAGGKYMVSHELGSYFSFPSGILAADVLRTLQDGGQINVKKETQFFATPRARAIKAVAPLGDLNGKDVLEPSAGDGALADVVRDSGGNVATIENWSVNADALRGKGYNPIEQDFLSVTPAETGLFDAVVMNHPFSKGQDAQHFRHALSFLKPDGSISAILSTAHKHNSRGEYAGFKDLLDVGHAMVESVEAGEFRESGTNVSTTMVYMSMERLLHSLRERGETGEEYGLDLSFQWASVDEQPRAAQVERVFA